MKYFNVKFPLTESIQRKLSVLLLNFAEKLPKPQEGLLFELQSARLMQRDEADNEFERTKAPENANLDLLGFRFFELFPIEKYDELENGIGKIFQKKGTYETERFDSTFSVMRKSIFAGHWYNLGYIVHNQSKRLGFQLIRRMNLPKEIDCVHVTLKKILPSVFAIIFDVNIKPEASKVMHGLQRDKYLSEIIYKSIMIPGFFLSSYGRPSCSMKNERIFAWKEEIRINLEKQLSKYFKGLFFNTQLTKSKLPSIEIFTLDAKFHSKEDFRLWAENNRFWFDSFNFNFFFDSYYCEELLFQWPDGREDNYNNSPFKIMLLKESINQAFKIGKPENSNLEYSYQVESLLNTITTQIAVLSNQQIFLNEFQKFREKIYKEFDEKRNSNINKILIDLNYIQKLQRKIERIQNEFEEITKYSDPFNDHELINKLRRFRLNKKKEPEKDFIEVLNSYISSNIGLLINHINFLDKYFDRYTNLANLKAINKMQEFTTWLAIGALVISILSLTFTPDQIIQFIKISFQYLQNLFEFSKGLKI